MLCKALSIFTSLSCGACGILPKKVPHDFLSLGHADGPPCNTWHLSFHPGGKFCTADVLPSPDISQPAPTIGWERSAIQIPRSDMSGSAGNTYPEYIRR